MPGDEPQREGLIADVRDHDGDRVRSNCRGREGEAEEAVRVRDRARLEVRCVEVRPDEGLARRGVADGPAEGSGLRVGRKRGAEYGE